ncbi:hypothetical protein ABZ307_05005 [Streptomyces griseorubiginosus]|uniref:hypothetical protein n=1 Tax=Streptomyces griseorubiginosus TaxID=67304 RepID=UPI0033B0995D
MTTGRRTATGVALVGALALTLLNAPAAQAQDTGIKVTDIVINKGKPIVVGTSKPVEPSISFTITLPSGYSTSDPSRYDAYPFIYRGTLKHATDTGDNYIGPGGYTCYEQSDKKAECEGSLYIDPHPSREHVDSNSDATTWKTAVALRLFTANHQLRAEEHETRPLTVQLKRAAKVTVNASPEPVVKGKKITVTGKLTRADWATKKYGGYGGRSVSLQFRETGTNAFVTVKKVTTSSTGALKTTVTASKDGTWRWAYGGNDTTGATTSGGDHVDVR